MIILCQYYGVLFVKKKFQVVYFNFSRLIIETIYVLCIKCGHGGHIDHIKDWFFNEKYLLCPSCGICQCFYSFL